MTETASTLTRRHRPLHHRFRVYLTLQVENPPEQLCGQPRSPWVRRPDRLTNRQHKVEPGRNARRAAGVVHRRWNSLSSSSSWPLPLAPTMRFAGWPSWKTISVGDAHHVEAAGDVGVVVDVELGDRELAGLLGGDLVEDRGDHLARAAPLGPEVDEDGLGRGADDLLVEGGVGQGVVLSPMMGVLLG